MPDCPHSIPPSSSDPRRRRKPASPGGRKPTLSEAQGAIQNAADQLRHAELDASTYRRDAGEMIEWFEEFVQEPQRSKIIQRFLARLAEIRDQIVPMLEDPTLPATNNLAERQIRPAVIHRKISAGNKTQSGADALAILASLATSCRQQSQCFSDWVHRLLTTPVDQAVPFWLPNSAPS